MAVGIAIDARLVQVCEEESRDVAERYIAVARTFKARTFWSAIDLGMEKRRILGLVFQDDLTRLRTAKAWTSHYRPGQSCRDEPRP